MRIATAGIIHETSTFVDAPTTLHSFQNDRGVYRGQEIVDRFQGTNVCTGGFIEGANVEGFELVPLLRASAYPSGLIERRAYDQLKGEILSELRAALDTGLSVDGVLLDLHGAMVVDGIDDGDGDLIQAIRDLLGSHRPIVVTTDLHSNHSRRRVQAADAIVGFDTYPHVDMAERGREAATIVARTVRGEIKPQMAIHQLPLFWGCSRQITAQAPMDEVIQRLHDIERRTGIITATVSTGFAWADVPDVGCSVIVVADGSLSQAQREADAFAAWIWENRRTWYSEPVTVRQAIAEGETLGKYPIMLADHADNPGGGSPGDSTEMLQTFLDMQLADALLLQIIDPQVAQLACEAGQGTRLTQLPLGGKSHPVQGPPVVADFDVVATSDGRFRYDGPMFAGLDSCLGPSAWLRCGGVSAVVVSGRDQPFDTAFARTLGIDCRKMKYIGIKSAVHFRAAFEPLAGAIFNVDAAGLQTHDFGKLKYRKRRLEMFPVEIQ